jgi:hypothetical protein
MAILLLEDAEHPNAEIVHDGRVFAFERNRTAYRFVLQPSAQQESCAVAVPAGDATVRLAVAGRSSQLERMPSATLKVAIETCAAEYAVDGCTAWQLAHQFADVSTDCGGSAAATVQSAGWLRASWYAIPRDGDFRSLLRPDGSWRSLRFGVDVV